LATMLDAIQMDSELMFLIEHWPNIPQAVRAGMLAMVRASNVENLDPMR
jgi:hypothetical protein